MHSETSKRTGTSKKMTTLARNCPLIDRLSSARRTISASSKRTPDPHHAASRGSRLNGSRTFWKNGRGARSHCRALAMTHTTP